MKRWLALAVVGSMLAVPVASAASYTQPGNGPRRTGQIGYEGPQTNDTAFEVQLPGVPWTNPALVGEDLYVVTVSNERIGYDGDTENLTENALWRINIENGTVERVMDVPMYGGISPTVSPLDGERLILEDSETGELVAVDIPSGEEIWRTKALPADSRQIRDYGDVVQVGQRLYASFHACCPGAEGRAVGFGPDRLSGVMALDAESGEEQWTWTRTDGDTSGTGIDQTAAPAASTRDVGKVRLSADEDRVYAYSLLYEQVGYGRGEAGEFAYATVDKRTYELRALASDGESLWAENDTQQRRAKVFTSRGEAGPSTMTAYQCCAFPLVTETQVDMRLDAFEAYNPASGEEVWTSEAGRSDHIDRQGAFSMGIRDDVLIATSPQTVYRLDAQENGDIAWQHTSTDRAYANEPTVIDEDTAYVPNHPDTDSNFGTIGIEARDLGTGEVLWRWSHQPDVGIDSPTSTQDSSFPAYGPGVVAWPAKDGTVTVIGATEASLGEPPTYGDHYPPTGEPVTVNLSGAQPGALGPPTRHRVHWGDGTATGWQEDPELTHAYEEEGDYEARLVVGNANQTASTMATMHVGQGPPAPENVTSSPGPEPRSVTVEWDPPEDADHPFRYRVLRANSTDGAFTEVSNTPEGSYTDTELPGGQTYHYAVESLSRTGSSSSPVETASQPKPQEPNWIEERFQKENQDMTFGVLGLAVALGGGAIGVARRKRKQSLLQEELETLEAGFERTRENPGECEAFLDTRKARAQSLLLDGDLDEEQFGVLERRIDELHGELRTSVLDSRFEFLPHGMVQSLKKMLADGRISTWERDAIADLLDREEALTDAQKDKVRSQLDRWFAEDAGGEVA